MAGIISQPKSVKNNLYIGDHSPDIPDRDVLRDLMLNSNICQTVLLGQKDPTKSSNESNSSTLTLITFLFNVT